MTRHTLRRTAIVVAMIAGVMPATDLAAHATTSVNCASKSLQSAINAAAAGSTVLIKGTCSGAFTVNKNLTLEGKPTATLDGNDLGSVLTISGSPSVHLIDLTITGGLAAEGGGIDANGGSLNLNKVTVSNNLAYDLDEAEGGGIFAGGSLHVTSSAIVDNRALAIASGSDDADAFGGGITAERKLTITDSTVDSNRATASSPDASAAAEGGGISTDSSSVTIVGSHLDNNRLTGTGATTIVEGGACECSLETGSLAISHSTLSGNILRSAATIEQAEAGGGGLDAAVKKGTITDSALVGNEVFATGSGASFNDGVAGGAISAFTASGITISGSRITHTSVMVQSAANEADVDGGAVFARGVVRLVRSVISDTKSVAHGVKQSGVGGGGIEVESDSPNPAALSLDRSTVANNSSTVTTTVASASVIGGGISSGVSLSIVASTVSGNSGHTTAGGSGASAVVGGGIVAQWDEMGSKPKDHVTNSTIADNVANAHTASGIATVQGGGIWISDVTATLTNDTIADNSVAGSGGSVEAKGGGGFVDTATPTTTKATIIASNSAPTSADGPDCAGQLSSGGHNLLHSKKGCALTLAPSDKVGGAADLGALANNGGPTRTMALRPASPAINAIPKSACAVKTDQRGVHRPQGKGCDIGAYERKVTKHK